MQRFIGVFIIVLACMFLMCGCPSTPRVDPAILEYQRQIDSLETRIRIYERTTQYTLTELESIRARAGSIEGTVDEVIELFDAYQSAVERLLRYYSETEAEVED